MKTITVKGTGTASAKVDYVEISLSLEAVDKSYEEAMTLASTHIEMLTESLVSAGFKKEDLKTTFFNVSTEYRNVKDKYENYKQIFVGYKVNHHLKLSFDFSTERLSTALSAISSSRVDPRFSIDFTVKNPDEINEEMLRSATENALRKAEVLCMAAGHKLGELQCIDYNWGELDIYSETRYMNEMPGKKACCSPIDFVPEDINISDSVKFVWEII